MRIGSVAPSEALGSETALVLLGDGRSDLIERASRIEALSERIRAMEITSDRESGAATDLLVAAKAEYDKIEEARKARKQPVLAEARAIDAVFDPAKDAFTTLQKLVKSKIAHWIARKQEAAARALEEARRLQEEAALKQQEAFRAAQSAQSDDEKRAAESAMDASAQALIEAHRARPLESVVSGVRGQMGAVSTRGKRMVRVLDITLVPREALEEAAVKDDMKVLTRVLLAMKVDSLPGCEFYEDTVISVRRGLQ